MPVQTDVYAMVAVVGMVVGVIAVWVAWAIWTTSRPALSAADDDVFALGSKTRDEAGEWGLLWPM